jgi:hypothetical protein
MKIYFSHFPTGIWVVFPSMPSKLYILEGVVISRNCNTAGLGTWDIGFLFRKNFNILILLIITATMEKALRSLYICN